MHRRKFLFVLVCGFLLASAKRAEAETIVVVVIEAETGNPLSHATIIAHSPFSEKPTKSVADENGVASLSVPAGVYLLTSIYAERKHRAVVVEPGATVHIGIVLESKHSYCRLYWTPVMKSWKTGIEDDTHLDSFPISSLPLFSQSADSEARIFGLAITNSHEFLPREFPAKCSLSRV